MSFAVYLIRRPGTPAVTIRSFRETRFRPMCASRYPSIAAQFGQRASGGHSGDRVVKKRSKGPLRCANPSLVKCPMGYDSQYGQRRVSFGAATANVHFLLRREHSI